MAKVRLLSDLGGGRGTEGLTLFSEGCGVAADDGGLGISLSGWLLSKAMEVAWSSPDFGWCRLRSRSSQMRPEEPCLRNETDDLCNVVMDLESFDSLSLSLIFLLS